MVNVTKQSVLKLLIRRGNNPKESEKMVNNESLAIIDCITESVKIKNNESFVINVCNTESVNLWRIESLAIR